VKSHPNEDFHKNFALKMNSKKYSVLVQTDKAIYKASDKILFRVFILNGDMRPYEKENIQVIITDGENNRVKQFTNVSLHKGVFSGDLQLSDSPVLGKWKLQVKLDDKIEKTREIEVSEYTLPKFEFKIEANPNANYKDGKVVGKVEGKYTFGKSAKGNVTIRVSKYIEYRWYSPYELVFMKEFQIEGKSSFEFDLKKDLRMTETSDAEIKLEASFVEELTNREQNSEAKVKVHKHPHKIALEHSPEHFTPGVPLTVKALVTLHDKNTPVTDSRYPVKFTIVYTSEVKKLCLRDRPWVYVNEIEKTDKHVECTREEREEKYATVFISNGTAELKVEDLTPECNRIKVLAEYLSVENSDYIFKNIHQDSTRHLSITAEKTE
jgi:CD109 antigen